MKARCKRPLTLCFVAGVLSIVHAGCDRTHADPPPLAELHDLFREELESGQDLSARPSVQALVHSTRNAPAFRNLAESIPPERQPERVLYLASGSHIAPLAVCEALPPEQPCRLTLTEIDASVQCDLESFFHEARRRGYLRSIDDSGRLEDGTGVRTWRFRVGSRPVTVDLHLRGESGESGPSPLVPHELLRDTDLVISHDWSGDPFGNLDVILRLLEGSRAADLDRPPLLMIEDLEKHTFPVDLGFFSILARTDETYGHRGSNSGIGRHGPVELGPPIFGGGVVLGFDEPWLRWTDDTTLRSFGDFLLLNRYDGGRRNVLEREPDTVLVPELLDWWSGFGTRSLTGGDFSRNPELRRRAVEAALHIADKLDEPLATRLACRLELYRTVLGMRARGTGSRVNHPTQHNVRLLKVDEFPLPAMQDLYREALRHTGQHRAQRDADQALALELLGLFAPGDAQATLAHCGCVQPAGSTTDWAARHETLLRCLGVT